MRSQLSGRASAWLAQVLNNTVIFIHFLSFHMYKHPYYKLELSHKNFLDHR